VKNPEHLDVWDSAERGDTTILRYHLQKDKEKKVMLNARGAWERTPLHWACSNGQINTTEVLIEFGADINVRDEQGWTPLHFACNNGHKNVVLFLLKNGAKMIEDNFQRPPLYFAKKKSIRNLLLGIPKEREDSLADDLSKLVNDKSTSDIIIDLNGITVFAHRGILSARSEFFRSLLCGGMKETNSTVITLKEGENPQIFIKVLEYIYTGRVKDTGEDYIYALNLLKAADHYCLSYMKYLCENIVEKKFTLNNIGEIISTAEEYMNKRLKSLCFDYVFREVENMKNPKHEYKPILSMNENLWKELATYLEERLKATSKQISKLYVGDLSKKE